MDDWSNAATFEIYGDVIFLDCMKRQINTVNWPYIAPVIVDGDSHIFVIAECLICAERLEGYAWVLESIFEMAPKRGRESLRIIFGDGIMSTRLLDMVGIGETCKLCLDVYHLLDVDWPRFFGSAYFLTIRSFFSDLVYSKSEDEYGSNLAKIRVKLQRNHQHLHYLENEIHSQRQKFVHCWVSSIEGTCQVPSSV